MRGCTLINDSPLVHFGPGISPRFSVFGFHNACLNLPFSVMGKNECTFMHNFFGTSLVTESCLVLLSTNSMSAELGCKFQGEMHVVFTFDHALAMCECALISN